MENWITIVQNIFCHDQLSQDFLINLFFSGKWLTCFKSTNTVYVWFTAHVQKGCTAIDTKCMSILWSTSSWQHLWLIASLSTAGKYHSIPNGHTVTWIISGILLQLVLISVFVKLPEFPIAMKRLPISTSHLTVSLTQTLGQVSLGDTEFSRTNGFLLRNPLWVAWLCTTYYYGGYARYRGTWCMYSEGLYRVDSWGRCTGVLFRQCKVCFYRQQFLLRMII